VIDILNDDLSEGHSSLNLIKTLRLV